MTIRNRELSQFGSFVYVDNSNQEIGITDGILPYVGIGTTNPQSKLHVIGDSIISGNASIGGNSSIVGFVSATSYYLNGNLLVNPEIQAWNVSGSNIYRVNGNVGIGISSISEKLEVIGNVKANQFISTVTTGTSPFNVNSTTQVSNLNASFLGGKTPPSGDIVGTTDSQTLSNKTLTSPIISTIINGGTITLPTVTGTLVSTGSTGVVTSNMIADLNIVNDDVAVGASIAYSKLNLSNSITNTDISPTASISVSKLANSTISGVSLGSSLNSLSFDSYLTSSGSYNGSVARTVSVAATTLNTANTIVSRDLSGDFSAGTINCSFINPSSGIRINGTTIVDSSRNLFNATNGNFSGIVTAQTLQATNFSIVNLSATNGNFSGIVTAVDFNSTSDQNLKTNIQTVQNSLEIINSLRGVNFDWKESQKPSIGVIAQELEQVLPELVTDTDPKTVNYNGLIGVLIEAVKELSAEVEELKKTINK